MYTVNTFILRIKQAILTIPYFQDWLYSGILLLLFAFFSLSIGFYFKFLELKKFKQSSLETIGIIISSFFSPAITEELFFRVLLLPHVTETVTVGEKWLWGCISLVIFIIYHPLEGITVFRSGKSTFMNPVFLLLAAFLGILCTIIYFHTGSLWTSVVLHWIVVVVWLLLLGGYDKLNS